MTYEEFLEEWNSESGQIECRSSGSTGTPKTILIPKREMRLSAIRTCSFLNIPEGSHFHSCISPDYIGGKMMAVRAAVMQGTLTWEIPSNRPEIGHGNGKIDLLAVVPSQMIDIVERKDELPEISTIIIGGGSIPVSLRKKIARSGFNAWETYGMTETSSHIALRKVREEEDWFQTLEGITVTTTSESRLVINIEGWQTFVTNDIAEIRNSREFRIKGRADNVIISGGKKIHAEEVESILESALDCPLMITSKPDEKWGERVVLIIDDGKSEEADAKIMATCRRLLRPECVPKEIEHKKIPLTGNGKKQRRKGNC